MVGKVAQQSIKDSPVKMFTLTIKKWKANAPLKIAISNMLQSTLRKQPGSLLSRVHNNTLAVINESCTEAMTLRLCHRKSPIHY